MTGHDVRNAETDGRDWGRRAAAILHRQLSAAAPHPAIRSEMLRQVNEAVSATAERLRVERGLGYGMAWETAVRTALLESFVAAIRSLEATSDLASATGEHMPRLAQADRTLAA